MIRASSIPAARAVDRLLLAGKAPPEACECDQAIALRRQAAEAKDHLTHAIVRQAEIASSPTSDAGVVLTEMRMALSALEAGE